MQGRLSPTESDAGLLNEQPNTASNPKEEKPYFPDKLMKQVYQVAEEAILKGMAVGSKTFKNYLRNRITIKNVNVDLIAEAIETTNYSHIEERYMKDGKIVAKESQKYTLTQHAEERISKPERGNVTQLFKKYMHRAEKEGKKSEKDILKYLQENIKPRDISIEEISDVLDNGKCVKQPGPGKKREYSKGGITVIVSKADHAIITVYRNHTQKNSNTFHKSSSASAQGIDLEAKQAATPKKLNQ